MSSTPEHAETDGERILPHHTYLILGYVFAAVAIGAWLVQILIHPSPILDGLFELLRVAAVVAALGYFVHRAAHRVNHRLDHLERRIDERDGLVDEEAAAAARRLNLRLLSNQN